MFSLYFQTFPALSKLKLSSENTTHYYCILVFLLIITESCQDSRKVLPHIKVLAHAYSDTVIWLAEILVARSKISISGPADLNTMTILKKKRYKLGWLQFLYQVMDLLSLSYHYVALAYEASTSFPKVQKAHKTLWHKQSSIEENTRQQTLKNKTLCCALKNWKKWVEKNLSYFKLYVKINSPPVSQETTRTFWEENLEVGAKTLKALLIQTPLHFYPTNI